MIEKIKEYLSSADIEMVRLGVIIMQQHLPQDEWRPLLEEHSTIPAAAVPQNHRGQWYTVMTYPVIKWYYQINDNEVTIREPYNEYIMLPTFATAGTTTTTGSFVVDYGNHYNKYTHIYEQTGYASTTTGINEERGYSTGAISSVVESHAFKDGGYNSYCYPPGGV